jgi:hypothetical protein
LIVFHHYSATSPHGIQFFKLTDSITLRSLLWPYSRDFAILGAPEYGKPMIHQGTHINANRQGQYDAQGRPGYDLLVDNRYSYPALLHLAIFTDIMNIADDGLAAGWGVGQRSPWNQSLQRASVINGLWLSLSVWIFNIAYLFTNGRLLLHYLRARGATDLPRETRFFIAAWIPAASWYLLVVGTLPFISADVYYYGYWMPRLIAPALLIFGVVGLWGLERLSAFWSVLNLVKWFLALQIAVQAALLIR